VRRCRRVADALGVTDLDEQARSLARVLRARDVPIDRLAHNLRIAADVLAERLAAQQGTTLDGVPRRAALVVDALCVDARCATVICHPRAAYRSHQKCGASAV
jgi:hypothetical protein